MNWGTKIVISFVVFVGIIMSMVVISVKQDFFLVTENYYEQEIKYQDQIDRMTNHQNLTEKPLLQWSENKNQLLLIFPGQLIEQGITGNIVFFRPSDASLDRTYEIALSESGVQAFDARLFRNGKWKAKIHFSVNNKEFYTEQSIIL
jgi:hypothetical protein